MHEAYPLITVGAIAGIFSLIFIAAYAGMKNKKQAIGFDRNMSDGEIMRRLLRYARPHAGKLALVAVITLVSIGYDLAAPVIVGNIEELIKNDFPLRSLFMGVAAYAAILLVSVVCTYCQSIMLQKIGQRIVSKIREDTFEHIESLAQQQLNAIPVGTLVTRVSNDANAVSMMFTNILVTMAKNVFVVFGILVAMLMLNYMLTLMVLCFVPFLVLFTVIFRKFSRSAYRRVKDCTTDINTFLSENLSGIKLIQSFNREEHKRDDFFAKSAALCRARERQIFVFGVFRPMVYMLYISSVLCLLYLGGRGHIKDVSFLGQSVTSGVVVTFYMYISKFFNPIQTLAEQFNMLQNAFASAEKIFTIQDIEPALVDEPDAVELESMRGEIEFRDVWFAYNPGEWVLKGVSFHVPAGSTAAFVGATGAGKSTILSLICRVYDIQKGEILIDGINIRHIKTDSLRRFIGQMLQDVFLFSGTVGSNITLRDDSYNLGDIVQACLYVYAHRFIFRLEHDYNEPILERGSNLSAGQRQLLSFARAVIRKPSVLILDEATANIDAETEQLIQKSLERMRSIGTMLIVAHRLSTVQHADNIIVLSHGQIIEQGTHAQLLKQRGIYHKMYMLQFSQDEGSAEA